jgi:hypothetical protein
MPTDNAIAGTNGGGGTVFRTYADAGGVEHPAGVVEYVGTLSAGNNTLVPVTLTAGLPVQPQTATTWAVTGTFWQTTQPVSAALLPLPTGASTAAKQPALGTAGTAASDVITVQGIASMTPLAVSAASLPLPAGAATAAKQPALGTAGSASTDVITVQGIASGTPQPVSAASLPLPAGAAADATLTGGSQKTQVIASTSGGSSAYTLLSAATTNAQSVKASAGQLYGYYISNVSAGVRFVKLYNKASAPTVGTDTPVLTFPIPTNGTSGAGANVSFNPGIAFSTGIAIAITGADGTADTTAIGVGDVRLNLLYA